MVVGCLRDTKGQWMHSCFNIQRKVELSIGLLKSGDANKEENESVRNTGVWHNNSQPSGRNGGDDDKSNERFSRVCDDVHKENNGHEAKDT